MIKFVTIVFLLAGTNGQYYIPHVVQQPYFYQAPQFYNPLPQLFQPPVFYQQPLPYNNPHIQKSIPQVQSRTYEDLSPKSPIGVVPENFRGFGYHTNFDDGATSTVVFFNGPQRLNSNTNTKTSVTVASDSLDPQNKENLDNATGRIGKSIANPTDSFAMIKSFLNHPNLLGNGINYFTADFSAPGYPASTIPLNPSTTTTERVKEATESISTTETSVSSTTESSEATTVSSESESTEDADQNVTTEQINDTTTI
ncbi:unnamed protein product [Brassicogethes aeneus]|uniref:Uncharacterized protein n=1 Tax=Brassicogethes aeneus TaxID=1431903 RepID=A0A9P0BGY8_BRAAE|nr:unnamed protein product [Brassicogethes aeneus]